jgi:hypothetical protein
MQVIVMTSDNQHKCLNPFMWLWRKYWNPFIALDSKVICGFTPPDIEMVDNWRFHSIGKYEDYPANKWSDAFIKVLNEVAQEQFILMLEDYWPVRQIDTFAVKMLFDYARQFKNVLKIDLTYERLYINGGSNFLFGVNTYDHCGYLDLVKSPPGTMYQMSLWGGIWNREQLKRFIIPGEFAQQIEIAGTPRVTAVGDEVLVLGTRQAPLLHGNIYQSRHEGKPVYEDSGWKINDEDMKYMRFREWLE